MNDINNIVYRGGIGLRTFIRITILTTVIFFIMIYYYSVPQDHSKPLKDDNHSIPPKIDYFINDEQSDETTRPKEGLSVYIGKKSKTLVEDYGEPQRIDISAYGYEWWIYKSFYGTYMQVGVLNDSVVTIYAIGNQLNVSPYKIGQSIEDIFRTTILETEILVSKDGGTYRFELSEEDLNLRPLVQLGEIFVQLSIDKFSGTLSSIRFYDKNTLITQKPYELVYHGDLLEPADLDIQEWKEIENGAEQQIFDITNVIRNRLGLNALEWDDKLSKVAYDHSKDMFENSYLSHESPEFGSLEERLQEEEIEYQTVAENIAEKYMDGPAVVEGWLNSDGHRKTLLDENYSKLGVGVFGKYYTQNFIQEK